MTSISAALATYTTTATQRATKLPETDKTSDTGSHVIADTVSFSPRSLELMQRRNITDQERIAFKDILNKAAAAKAHDDPEQFLKSLSSSEMEVLRNTHSLASPINIDALSFEGAYNLLHPPSEAEDLNNDGGLTVGIGTGWEFPPPNASDSVKKSWETATAGLSELDNAVMQGKFLFSARFKNMIFEDGQFVKEIQAGDPEYRNIFGENDFSYQDMTQYLLDALEFDKKNMSKEMYEMEKGCLDTFMAQLQEREEI